MARVLLKPGATLGDYPEREVVWPEPLELWVRSQVTKISCWRTQRRWKSSHVCDQVNSIGLQLSSLSDAELRCLVDNLREKLLIRGLQDDLIWQAFALIREVSSRVLSQRHYDEQVLAAWVLVKGGIAEMETGQGKTLMATLATCTAALADIPVHVMTANDYLAQRDEQLLRPLYQWLGLSSGSVIDGVSTEQRADVYGRSIVHATAAQIAFDYLRDRMEVGHEIEPLPLQFRKHAAIESGGVAPLLMRGLCFGVLDEADSLLIDEAKTPLVISAARQDRETRQQFYDALYLADALNADEDYRVMPSSKTVKLTERGRAVLAELCESLGDYWQRVRQRDYMVSLALQASEFFRADRDYVVIEGKVVIVDPLTGRLMPDRAWEYGLHQLIEAKEGCEITAERSPLTRISYQSFFRRYLHLCGMSGTVSEVAEELRATYGLPVQPIPTHQPVQRNHWSETLFVSDEARDRALIERLISLLNSCRPVLIGTRTIEESLRVSELLQQREIAHQVLNGRQNTEEAEVVAAAGQATRITVATNMAGRGTDIPLDDLSRESGGLHVIAMGRNRARRIDRQLYGRCGRQGDPGSTEGLMSLQDPLIAESLPAAMLKLVRFACGRDGRAPSWLARWALAYPQKRRQQEDRRQRLALIQQERMERQKLAFSANSE